MNYAKNPKLARKLVKERKKLAQLAREGKDVKGVEKLNWEIEFENFDETEYEQQLHPRQRKDSVDVKGY